MKLSCNIPRSPGDAFRRGQNLPSPATGPQRTRRAALEGHAMCRRAVLMWQTCIKTSSTVTHRKNKLQFPATGILMLYAARLHREQLQLNILWELQRHNVHHCCTLFATKQNSWALLWLASTISSHKPTSTLFHSFFIFLLQHYITYITLHICSSPHPPSFGTSVHRHNSPTSSQYCNRAPVTSFSLHLSSLFLSLLLNYHLETQLGDRGLWSLPHKQP